MYIEKQNVRYNCRLPVYGDTNVMLMSPMFLHCQALELLPPSIKIKDVLVYLENVLELKSATKHRSQVLRNMLFSESLQVIVLLHH